MRRLILIALAVLLVIAYITNPSAQYKHEASLKTSIEEDLMPAISNNLKQEVRSDENILNIITGAIIDSDLGQGLAATAVEEMVKVEEVKDYYLFSIGKGSDGWLTFGCYGKVWCKFSLMTDSQIQEFISQDWLAKALQ